jgi:subtilisin family serine protease
MRKLRVIRMVGLAISFLVLVIRPGNASESVKVAILDSGSNIAYKEGISLIGNTVKDDNGHGTLIAGVIKETCPEAELYIIKVIGKDGLAINEETVILGLKWAISKNVNVINMSLRLRGSDELRDAIRQAYEKGIVMTAAAGNTTSAIGALEARDAMRPGHYEVAYPARYPEVIAVGALDRYGRAYEGSIGGRKVEVFCKGYSGRKAGTSIASAYAAGIAAKIISGNTGYGVEEIRCFMKGKYGKAGIR